MTRPADHARLTAWRLAHVLGAALALAAPLGGCSLLVDAPTPQITNRCEVDGDCGTRSRCDTAHQMCVSREAPSYALQAEITPAVDPLGGTPVPMLFDLGVLSAASRPELVVPLAAPIEGTARFDGAPIAAQVTFSRRIEPGVVVGAALSGSVSVRASASTSGAVDFVTQLPAGAVYDVKVEPLSEFRRLLPPLYATLVVPDGAGVSVPIEYRSEDLTRVYGVVQDADGSAQAGLLVRGVDPSSGRTISSATSTDDAGRFVLVMPTSTSSFAFRIRGDSTRQDSSALFPAITIDASALVPNPDGSFVLLVPASDRAMRLEGTVELPATLGQNLPAVGAQVHLFSSHVSDPETNLSGSLELSLTTDAEGRFVGYVLPGDYAVEIVAAEEETGVLVDDFEVISNPSNMILGQVFTLPERSILGGTVQLSDGEPVDDVRVHASALGLELVGQSAPAARLNRSVSGLSGSMGEFRLPLDVGMYDLVVEMPASTGYAWHVEHDYGVGTSDAPLRRVMSVRAPFRLEGSARFADGTPLEDASVRLFAIDETSGRMIEIGVASCGPDGDFVALLPPAIE